MDKEALRSLFSFGSIDIRTPCEYGITVVRNKKIEPFGSTFSAVRNSIF